jgi:hypothetical protein
MTTIQERELQEYFFVITKENFTVHIIIATNEDIYNDMLDNLSKSKDSGSFIVIKRHQVSLK